MRLAPWHFAVTASIAAACSSSYGGSDATETSTPEQAEAGADGAGAAIDAGGGADGADASATDGDAGAAVDPLFADPFDDNAPMPRAWDLVSGTPEILTDAGATSPPGVLHAHSSASAPAECYLKKTIATAGKTKISCSFDVQLRTFSGLQFLYVAKIAGDNGEYIALQLTDASWHAYGQYGTQEFAAGANKPIMNTWYHATMTLEAGGRATVTFGGDVREMTIDGGTTSTLRFTLGIQQGPAAHDYDVIYDGVVCTAQ